MSLPHSELDALGPLAEAFLSRYRSGERPSVTEYTEKYPDLAEQIREVFPALVVMEELGAVEEPQMASTPPAVPGQGKVPERLGDYRILREVGRGGMGIVYEAVQESLGRQVALKVLPLHGLLSPTHLERFRREAQAAARLHHTNIVPVHGVGEYEGYHFYAMQFIQGQGLDEVLKEVKRLRDKKVFSSTESPGTSEGRGLAQGLVSKSEVTTQSEAQYFRSVAKMGMQVAEALDYAHKQGVLHRDIKPSNLLLDSDGTVWVTDFGLAKAEDADELTHTGDLVGTLRYMAPERFHGLSDPRSDVYALGITLYELLTLRPAFDESSRPRRIERIMQDDPPRPRKVDRAIPRDLETIVQKAIAKEPARRYQTAGELAGDLGRFLAGEPVRARRVRMWERAGKWIKRRPAAAALLAVSAAAATVFVAGILLYNAQLAGALQQARRAEQEKTRQLAIAHLNEARARRNSGLLGRRFESLEALKKAADLFRDLNELDEERTLELRTEAIACLALADLRSARTWNPDPGWSPPSAFDPTGQSYVLFARPERGTNSEVSPGQLSIRRFTDDREIVRLPGFGIRVVAASFSPDGRYLAAHYESGERHNYVWDVNRGEPILKVPQGGYVSVPAFSPDSRLVALARPDHSIRVYHLPSGATWKDLAPDRPVNLVQFHPDGRRLAVVSKSTVRLRDLGDGKELPTFKHSSDVLALAWRSDGKVLVTGCFDHDIYLWDVANPDQTLRILKGHFGAVINLAFSHGGDLLLSESWDSTARLWDPMTGQQLVSKPAGPSAKHPFSPDDQRLEYGWEMAPGRECRAYRAGNDLNWMAVSPQGRLLASVSGTSVQLWDLEATHEGDKLLATLPVGPSMAVDFDPMSDSLITVSKSAGLQRWPITPDPETGGLRIGPPGSVILSHRAPITGNDPEFALSTDGRTVAYGLQPGQVLVFDRENPLRKFLIADAALRNAAFSPNGRWLATGNWHGKGVRLWDLETGKPAREFEVGGPAAWPTFNPDGKWLVTGTFAEYRFWEVGSWQERDPGLPREHDTKSRARAVFSPDGKMVALLHGVTGVRLVDPETGREFARLSNAGCPFCFSPDGSQLVTLAGTGAGFQVWDLRWIRRELAELNLDWDLPPYPPSPSESAAPLHVKVLTAEPLPPSKELDARAYLERGLFYVQLRQYPQGLADIVRATDLRSKGLDWEQIVRAYSQAIDGNYKDPWTYHRRAHAQEQLKQWDKAIADFSRAIEHEPRRVEHRVCRGRAYLRTGQKDKATEDFRKAGEQDAEWANRLAWEQVTLPNSSRLKPSLAVELAKQAVRQAPNAANYLNTLGVAHYRAGEWNAAVKALDRAEKLAPDKHTGFNAFFQAMCQHQLGDGPGAKHYYDRAIRWCQENQGKLPADQQQQLTTFRAEAEALLKARPPSH